MGFWSKLFGKKRVLLIKAPEAICPNCWGKQEWDKKYFDIAKDKQIDVNNKASAHAFIQDFVVTHLEGIKLKKEKDYYQCPTCSLKYHPHK